MPLGPSICVIRVIPPIFLFHSIPIAGFSETELRRNRIDSLSRLDLNGGQMELAGTCSMTTRQGTWQPDDDSSNAADRKKPIGWPESIPESIPFTTQPSGIFTLPAVTDLVPPSRMYQMDNETESGLFIRRHPGKARCSRKDASFDTISWKCSGRAAESRYFRS